MSATVGFASAAGWKRRALALAAIGLGATIFGFLIDRKEFFTSYLAAYMVTLAYPMGCFGILMIHNLTGGNWGWTIRPMLEAGTRTVPIMAVLFLPILVGARVLYPWLDPELMAHDSLLQTKTQYLNYSFWLVRTIVYFALWSLWSQWLLKRLIPAPGAGTLKDLHRVQRISAAGMLIYMFTMSFAAMDWVMSLEPHWFSSIFGAIVVVGQGNTAFGFCTLVAVLLAKRDGYPWATQKNIHDLAKFLFMTCLLWAYTNLSQYLIIWAGNLSEEVYWYHERGLGIWKPWTAAVVLGQFAIPFLVLLPARQKTNPKVLSFMVVWMLVIRFLENLWMVAPGLRYGRAPLYWLDFVAPVGLLGLWMSFYFGALRSKVAIPLPASIAHGHGHSPLFGGAAHAGPSDQPTHGDKHE